MNVVRGAKVYKCEHLQLQKERYDWHEYNFRYFWLNWFKSQIGTFTCEFLQVDCCQSDVCKSWNICSLDIRILGEVDVDKFFNMHVTIRSQWYTFFIYPSRNCFQVNRFRFWSVWAHLKISRHKALLTSNLGRQISMNSAGTQSIYRWTFLLLTRECIASKVKEHCEAKISEIQKKKNNKKQSHVSSLVSTYITHIKNPEAICN